MSSRAKAIAGALALVIAVGLFLVLRSDSSDDSTETAGTETQQSTTVAEGSQPPEESKPAEEPKPETQKPEVPTIVVEGGQPVGGVQELSFTAGDDIRFVVESDVDEEVHFHGYDISQDVTAGGRVEFDVPAMLEGVFEVELEESVVPIAEISINPA